MSAPLVNRLQEKVQQAVSELASLKKERERLLAEVDLMQEENRRARRIMRSYGEALQERKKLKERLQEIFENLDKLKV